MLSSIERHAAARPSRSLMSSTVPPMSDLCLRPGAVTFRATGQPSSSAAAPASSSVPTSLSGTTGISKQARRRPVSLGESA